MQAPCVAGQAELQPPTDAVPVGSRFQLALLIVKLHSYPLSFSWVQGDNMHVQHATQGQA